MNQSPFCERFLALFTNLSNNENIRECEVELPELVKNEKSIFALLEIAQTSQNQTIQHYALVFARKYFLNVIDAPKKYLSVDYSPLKKQLFDMILNAKSLMIQMAICNVVDVFASFVIENGVWEELPQFCFMLLESELCVTGLYLLNLVYSILPDDGQINYFIKYGTYITNGLLSDSLEMRKQGINGIYVLMSIIVDENDILTIPNLIESLSGAAQNAIFKYQDQEECGLLFGLISDLLSDRFKNLVQYYQGFCEFALSVCNKEEIPILIRIYAQQIIDNAPEFIPEFFEENFNLILESIIKLTLEACNEERDTTYYKFAQHFFEVLSCNVECFDMCVEFISSLIQLNDPITLQVAIYLLSCFVENCSDSIIDSIDVIIKIALEGLKSTDELVALEAAELVFELSSCASSSISEHIDDFVEALIPRISNHYFLIVLDSVLMNSEKMTTHLESLINICFQLLNSDFKINFKEDVMYCLNDAIDNCPVNEKIYPILAQPLISLMNHESSLVSLIFQCFGTLSDICPASIIKDLDEIVNFMFSVCKTQIGTIQALLSFIEKFPKSMSKFKDQSIEFAYMILDMELEDENLEELSNSRAAAIQCLSYLQPTNIKFVQYLAVMIPSIINKDKQSSAIAFSNAMPMLASHTTLDPTPFLIEYLQDIPELEEPETVTLNINAIISMITYFDKSLTIGNANEISQFLLNSMNGEIKVFKNSESRKTIETVVLHSIYQLFIKFVSILSDAFNNYLNPFQRLLIENISSKNKNLKGYSIYATIYLSTILKDNSLITPTLNAIIQQIKIKHISLRTNIMKSLLILIRYESSILMKNQNLIKNIITQILSEDPTNSYELTSLFEITSALWCRCVLEYNWPASNEDINAIFSKISLQTEDDFGITEDFALFCIKLSQLEGMGNLIPMFQRIAIRAFSLPLCDFVMISQNSKVFLKDILNGCINDIESIICFDQREFETIIQRLKE